MQDEAFEHAIEMHKDRIHTYAARMLRDREEARDVAQEALVKLWQHRSRVDEDGARPWLMRITHNLCIDRIRKRKVRSEVDGDNLLPMEPDPGPGPRQRASSSELGQLIDDALATLTAKDRAVVLMREVQGLPYDEIAAALGMPLGTLKARLHRARERLRSKLVRTGATP